MVPAPSASSLRRFDKLTVRLSLTVLSGVEWTAPSEVEGLRSGQAGQALSGRAFAESGALGAGVPKQKKILCYNGYKKLCLPGTSGVPPWENRMRQDAEASRLREELERNG